MKCSFLVVVVLLAALALAAPSSNTDGDIRQITNTYPPYDPQFQGPDPDAAFFSDHNNDHGEERPSVEDNLAQLRNLTASDWTFSTDPSSNNSASTTDTVTTAGSGAAKPGEYAVAIRLGPSTQHVGTLRKNRLYDEVYRCLKYLNTIRMPLDIYELCQPAGSPNPHDSNCKPYCHIDNIVWNGNVGGTPAYKSGTIMIVRSWWPYWDDESKNPGNLVLRDVTFRLIASIYAKMTEVKENCYQIDFHGSRRTTMCNIAKQILIAYPVNGGPVQDVGKVDIEFYGKTEEGAFGCKPTVDLIYKHFQSGPHKSEISKELNWPMDKIVPQVTCINKAMEWNCLDWYKPKKGEMWTENPKCKIPQFE